MPCTMGGGGLTTCRRGLTFQGGAGATGRRGAETVGGGEAEVRGGEEEETGGGGKGLRGSIAGGKTSEKKEGVEGF
jgi:hypothetical protein